MLCSNVSHRCVLIDPSKANIGIIKPKDYCEKAADCPHEKHCLGQKCTERLGEGAACNAGIAHQEASNGEQCRDGLYCNGATCEKLCREQGSECAAKAMQCKIISNGLGVCASTAGPKAGPSKKPDEPPKKSGEPPAKVDEPSKEAPKKPKRKEKSVEEETVPMPLPEDSPADPAAPAIGGEQGRSWLIYGSIFGAAILVIILVGALLRIRQNKQRRRKHSMRKEEDRTPTSALPLPSYQDVQKEDGAPSSIVQASKRDSEKNFEL